MYIRFIRSTRFLLFIFFLLGFLLRLYIASRYPHPPFFDENEYLFFADKIKNQFWWSNCCYRGFGYPMFLTIIFALFGSQNFQALAIIQALLDTTTALLLFVLSNRIFHRTKWAWIVYILYLFNPLTASYTGMILTETFAIFLLTLTMHLFFYRNKNVFFAFLFGATWAYLVFTRIVYWWWMIGLFALLGYITYKQKQLTRFIPTVLGIIIIMVYPIAANYRIYKTLTPLPPFPSFLVDFVLSLKITHWPALLSEWDLSKLDEIHAFTDQVYGNYDDRDVFIQNIQPHLQKTFAYIWSHPLLFVQSRGVNILRMWDKSNLYYFWDPYKDWDRPLLRIGNGIFLALVGLGIIHLIRKKKKSREEKYLLVFTLFTLFYFTVPFSLSVPEERHTLTIYSLLLLFVPGGVSLFYSKVTPRFSTTARLKH